MREQEYCIANGDKNLYGVLYLPDETAEPRYPLVISSHGFGGSYVRNRDYAERITGHGFAFYCFDFYGGSEDSKSGGSMKGMSVLTEAGDLEAVFNHLRMQEMIDENHREQIATEQEIFDGKAEAERESERIAALATRFKSIKNWLF